MTDIIFSELLNVAVFVLLALGLNLINGFTGVLNLGHAAFYGIGAYAAVLYLNAFSPELYSAAYWLHLGAAGLVAFLAAGLFGIALAVPCLRLTGDYLAIATLAFAEIVRILVSTVRPDILGGPLGLRVAPGKIESHWAFALALAIIAVTILMLRNLKQSATGRAYLAIRENEIAAQSLGMNTAYLRVQAFALGSAIAGLCGALYAASRFQIGPKDFDLMKTIMILLMIVLGGLGSISGAVLGALVLGALDPLIRYSPEIFTTLTGAESAPGLLQGAKENPQLIYAVLLILVIRWRPEGLFGLHEINVLWQRRGHKAEAPPA